MNTKDKPINKKAIGRLREKTDRILEALLRQGFYGTITLEVSLVDGIIRNIRTRVEEQELVGKE